MRAITQSRHAALGLLLALGACAAPLTPAGDVEVTEAFAVGGGNWSSGGGITAVAQVFEREGLTVVCGAWMTDRQSVLSSLRNQDVMQAGAVFAGGQGLVRNLGFMRRYEENARLLGRRATCVQTGLAWQQAFGDATPSLRFPRMTFGSGGMPAVGAPSVAGVGRGDTIVFRQGPRPAPW